MTLITHRGLPEDILTNLTKIAILIDKRFQYSFEFVYIAQLVHFKPCRPWDEIHRNLHRYIDLLQYYLMPVHLGRRHARLRGSISHSLYLLLLPCMTLSIYQYKYSVKFINKLFLFFSYKYY